MSRQPTPRRHARRPTPAGSDELRRLAEERHRVLEHHPLDERLRMPAPPHLHAKRGTAIGSLGPQSQAPATQIRSGPVPLDDVDRALRRDLGLRIERQSRPEAVLEDRLDRVLLGVIDRARARASARG